MHTFIFTSSVRYTNEYMYISIDHAYEERERYVHSSYVRKDDDRKSLERRANKKKTRKREYEVKKLPKR